MVSLGANGTVRPTPVARVRRGRRGSVAVIKGGALILSLTLSSYRCVWGLIIFLHVVHAVAYGYEVSEYWNIADYGNDINKVLRIFRLGNFFQTRVLACVLVASTLVSTIHGLLTLRALFWSIKLRRLVFFPPPKSKSESTMTASVMIQLRWKRCLSRQVRWLCRSWSSVFGMESDHFDAVRDTREAIEIASQSYTMYIMGNNVSSRTLYVYVEVSLALNCWSTPLIQHLWHHDVHRRRYFRLLIGILLGCSFTIVAPFIGYLRFKNAQSNQQWHDIAWSSNFLAQLQQLLTNTWIEFVSSRLNVLMITIGMETLKERVQCADSTARPHRPPHALTNGPATPSDDIGALRAAQVITVRSRDVAAAAVAVSSSRKPKRRFLFVGFGVVILGICINSLTQSPFVQPRNLGGGVTCQVEVHPWFQFTLSCLALEINCLGMGANGSASEIGAELKNVRIRQVVALIISNCPQLEMPAEIQSLSSLRTLEVFNSKIRKWDKNATLSSSSHPRFASLRLVLVTGITELPLGLQSPMFLVTDIEFSVTDLASLPSDLHEKWPQQIERVTIEGSRLAQIPDSLIKLNAVRLQLASNGIMEVLSSPFINHLYGVLMLSGNPIQELPTSLVSGNNTTRSSSITVVCYYLLLQLTSIQELPEWTKSGGVQMIYAGSTPFCSTHRSASWTNSTSSTGDQIQRSVIDCTLYPSPVALSFPVLQLAQLRAPEFVDVILKRLLLDK